MENSSLYIGNISSIVIYVLIYFKNVGKGILQSILSSEMCLNSRKKRRERSSEVNIPPRRLRLLKHVILPLKTTQKSKVKMILLFCSYFKSNKERAYTLSLHYLPPILLPSKIPIIIGKYHICSLLFVYFTL